jgi:hypothetical protein
MFTCCQTLVVLHRELDLILFGNLLPQLQEVPLVHLAALIKIDVQWDDDSEVEDI